MDKTLFNGEQIAKYVKAFSLISGLAGHEFSPENQQLIITIAGLVYTLVTIVQGIYFKSQSKTPS